MRRAVRRDSRATEQARAREGAVRGERLRLDAGLARAHYGLGNVLNFEGDYEGAAAHYRATLEASPDHARALVNLAGILAFQGKLEEAASLCRRALEADPKAFATNLQLGQVLSQKRSYREAIPYLQAAIEARPDSGPAHRQLSLALVAVGDLSAAWKHVERARELGDPLPPTLVEELRRARPGELRTAAAQTLSKLDDSLVGEWRWPDRDRRASLSGTTRALRQAVLWPRGSRR